MGYRRCQVNVGAQGPRLSGPLHFAEWAQQRFGFRLRALLQRQRAGLSAVRPRAVARAGIDQNGRAPAKPFGIADAPNALAAFVAAGEKAMWLEQWGWNSYFAAVWKTQEREEAWSPARVVSEQRSLWRIVGDFGAHRARECWAVASGRLREGANAGGDWPAVGDWVAAELASGEQRGVLHAVLPRRSQFVRKVAGRRVEQHVIAANVDTVFLVTAIDGDYNLRRLERYLAQCWESGARPVILVNKADAWDADTRGDLATCIAEVGRIARGVAVLPLSALTGQGAEGLAPFLAVGQTIVLLGSSGVGKSTLVNRLLGRKAQSTQPVRQHDGRGRHTTTARELLKLPGGAMLIDTPGLRELQLWEADEGIAETFADIEQLAAECRFRDCRHQSEPGCAVLAALAAGVIDSARLENRRKLEREQEFLRRKMDPEARSEAQHKLRTLMRGVKKMYEQRNKDWDGR
jgi:ribosome biogenesis GTPase